jgi:hypothetical protein
MASNHSYRRERDFRYIKKKCAGCGKTGIRASATRCSECSENHRRQLNTARQRRLRAIRAGRAEVITHVGRHVTYREVKPVAFTCQHCGSMFSPKRTTAKFCSPKCRVAAYRNR